MIELSALLICAFMLFIFGVSIASLIVISAIMLFSFIFIGTISFIFKFGFWILLGIIIYSLVKSD